MNHSATTQPPPAPLGAASTYDLASDGQEPLARAAGQGGAAPGPRSHLPGWLRAVHWLIILNFTAQLFYVGFQVFVTLQPADHAGPMFGAAAKLPYEQMMVRRAYSIEGWITMVGLTTYLAITEVLPRRWR